ncbi:MAG: polyamine ABC transporter substrate-binding protein [Proteobacteria bacterium]|nr:polyamine ABC transporter substrate-binding protein [Pseudomonadota bacterium]
MCQIKKILTLLTLLCLLHGLHAEEEKIVNFYNWADYIGKTTIADFEKEFGIKVNYDIYDTSEIVDAKLMAGRTGYDVIIHAASFSGRLVEAGIFQQLDKSKLSNLKHMDPDVMQNLADFGLGDHYSVPYMWGTTGISYNIDMLKERMPDVPLETADFFFKPEIISRFADCGVTVLDSSIDVLPMVMNYLGYHGNSIDPEHLKEAEQVMKSIRPYSQYFSSAKMLIDMPNKEVCVAMSWSGDYSVARTRAEEAGIDINLGYSMLEKGVPTWIDGMFIPSDAPHPNNAHLLINYLMRPEVIAPISNFIGYANGNRSATALVDPRITNDPAIYPNEDVKRRLQPALVYSPKVERPRSRTFTRIKSGL